MRKQLITKHLITAALMLGGLTIPVAGCSSHYYRVTHPTSGNEYYTTKVEDVKGGAVKIKDDKTGSMVTLQSSDVKEISEDQYHAGLTAPAKPAPVQPAAVQPVTPQAAPAQPTQPAAVQPATPQAAPAQPTQPAAVQPAAAQAAPAQP